jgi:hypothetical protein
MSSRKRICLAVLALGFLSAGASAAPAWSAQATVVRAGQDPQAGTRPAVPQSDTIVSLFRLDHRSDNHHFYTTSWPEAVNAINNLGYSDEGICCHVMTAASADGVPLYRLYSPSSDDHFYTTSWPEATNAFNNLGYKYEGIAARVWTSGGTPLYRLYSPSGGDHFYTISWSEAANAFNNLGYKYEGIAAYVQP